MCFDITDKTRYTAKKDIVVYKHMEILTNELAVSYFTKFKYKKDLLYTIKHMKSITNAGHILGPTIMERLKVYFMRTVCSHRGEVHLGYHSFIDLSQISSTSSTTAKFVIPQGAKYYKNDTHYVSDKIIYKGKFKYA